MSYTHDSPTPSTPSDSLAHPAFPPPSAHAALARTGQAGQAGQAMKQRHPVAVWLLPVVTFGIYGLVWWFKINSEMGRFDPRRPVSAGISLLAITFGAFILVPPYVSVYNTGQRIAERQRAAGLSQTCSPVLGLVLVFVFGLYSVYYQAELNKINEHYGNLPQNSPVALAA